MPTKRHHHWTRDKKRTTPKWFWAKDESGQFEALVYREGRVKMQVPNIVDGALQMTWVEIPDIHEHSHKLVALRRMATRYFKARSEGREW